VVKLCPESLVSGSHAAGVLHVGAMIHMIEPADTKSYSVQQLTAPGI
jgi:hypothetical protein